jgi:DNA-binding XRE family transcriptional regulator
VATLREWRATHGKTQAWVSEQLETDQATISRLEACGRTNNLRLAAKISALTNGEVPVEVWLPGLEEPEAA